MDFSHIQRVAEKSSQVSSSYCMAYILVIVFTVYSSRMTAKSITHNFAKYKQIIHLSIVNKYLVD